MGVRAVGPPRGGRRVAAAGAAAARWLALLALACGALVASSPATAPAGASSIVPGLGTCDFDTVCDLSSLHDVFPDYRTVCPSENCGMVAAADWLYAATGVIPGASALAADFRADGGQVELGTNFAPLWRYWTTTGLAGEDLTGHAAIARSRGAVESAISTGSAVIAVDTLAHPGLIGSGRHGAGTLDLVADGFTPKGPLVVLRHAMVQMTWRQWSAQVRRVWLPSVLPAPNVSSPPVTLSVDPPAIATGGGAVTLRFSARSASTCDVTSVPDLWASATQAVPCDGSLLVAVGSAPLGRTWTIYFDAHVGSSVTSTAQALLSQSAAAPSGEQATPDWSGVAVPASASQLTSVSGQFVVPTLNCADTPTGVVSIWDGLGGWNWWSNKSSGSLLQTGVYSYCLGGAQNNVGWWELWPTTPNIEVNFYNFPVSTGDAVVASVDKRPDGHWETRLDDLATGLSAVMVTGDAWGVGLTAPGEIAFASQGSAATVSYAGATTAEWIVEDPLNTLTDSSESFANFGSVTFSDLSLSPLALSLTTGDELANVQGGAALSAPTTLGADGFVTSYTGP